MKKLALAGLMLSLSLAAAGCQSTSEVVQKKEDLLTAAGFVPQPANTPAKQAAMKKLPPNKFVQQTQNNQVVYLYSDPIVCQCVYFGNQAAYGQYRQMVFQKNLADERRTTALIAQDTFDFDPWGPVFVY